MSTAFHYDSARSRAARYARRISGPTLVFVLLSGGWVLFVVGMLLVLVGAQFGWIISGFAGPFWMIALWGRELRDLPPGHGSNVDDMLERPMLGLLPKDPSSVQIAAAALGTSGGAFVVNRFLIAPQIIESAVEEIKDPEGIWQRALEIQQANNSSELTSVMVICAILELSPTAVQYLPHVGLSVEDLRAGPQWHSNVLNFLAQHNSRKSGGIGRDWAFGFTPLLERFGHNVSQQVTYGGVLYHEAPSHQEVMRQMANILASSGRRNSALVGGLGSGKTNIVHALAKNLLDADAQVPKSLHYSQVVSLDPATLIAHARGRGELEQLVQELCYEALKAKNIILFLDDAHLFFSDENSAVDLTNILLPVLDGGALRIIMAFDEQRWLQITQRNPQLSQYINRVSLQPTTDNETLEIMQVQSLLFEHQAQASYTYQSLLTALRLSGRYVAEQVMPGRALQLLESSGRYAEDGLVTKSSVEKAIEQTRGVKVASVDSVQERETLLNLEDRIHERMINQTQAVRVVSDALRRARTGVRNEKRPIGTFLFLGPTGVGKTELAKAIAAVFFGDEDSLIRIDLNEYVRSEDVTRLIADPAKDPHSLTAQIAKRPFSVVLLDEIEKAAPEVLGTLLQALDEGMLRDINNREVSFRDSVIIATSNAGAEKIIQHIQSGEQVSQFEKQFMDELIGGGQFKPEFLNRFDEIALFRPLGEEELLQVVDIILRGVNSTLASQKLSVNVELEAKKLLVVAGNDPRLGARPMRRIVQKTIENIVADQVLRQEAGPGSVIQISVEQVQTALTRTSEK